MDDNGLQIVNQPVTAKREGLALDGPLGIPPTAVGVVVFAHGAVVGDSVRATLSSPANFSKEGWPRSLPIY
jgi:hypothetical protein